MIGVDWIWERIKAARVFIFWLEKDDWTAVRNLILCNRLADRGDVIICGSKIIWCSGTQSSLYALQPSRKATTASFSIDVLPELLQYNQMHDVEGDITGPGRAMRYIPTFAAASSSGSIANAPSARYTPCSPSSSAPGACENLSCQTGKVVAYSLCRMIQH